LVASNAATHIPAAAAATAVAVAAAAVSVDHFKLSIEIRLSNQAGGQPQTRFTTSAGDHFPSLVGFIQHFKVHVLEQTNSRCTNPPTRLTACLSEFDPLATALLPLKRLPISGGMGSIKGRANSIKGRARSMSSSSTTSRIGSSGDHSGESGGGGAMKRSTSTSSMGSSVGGDAVATEIDNGDLYSMMEGSGDGSTMQTNTSASSRTTITTTTVNATSNATSSNTSVSTSSNISTSRRQSTGAANRCNRPSPTGGTCKWAKVAW
jgi:hypothetical protein